MKTCETCKYWAVDYKIENDVADCDKVDSIITDKSKTFEIEATASDDSGLATTLMTGRNFGCIHHEIKNKL